MESMDIILDSKEFAQCNSCNRIFRPWHMGTVYEPSEDGKHKYAKGYCPHCQSLMNYTIRDYTDNEIAGIEDIVKIKRGENIILNSLKNKPKTEVNYKPSKLRVRLMQGALIFIMLQWLGLLLLCSNIEGFSWFGMSTELSFLILILSGGTALFILAFYIGLDDRTFNN